MRFEKILVANRGEIAVRVIRTARDLGYRTVAVFSEADAGAAHVRAAHEAVAIGPAPASASYLRMDALIEAAQACGAEAVHPGYGFLSENAEFVRACETAGLVFIGPSADAIEAMGDKARAKARMQEAGVPMLPGYFGAEQDDARLHEEAQRLGYPLLIKPVAGGGGRGMRRVNAVADLADAIAGARRESGSAFGDDTLMLERYIAHGRHIEIQVLADNEGHTVHLGERDCTTQRRRQKVIEEAPSPFVDEAMRRTMGEAAVAAAKAIDYRGAGTVEFIVDDERHHYFLEMNTRLQVEHPVTEMICGHDLVELQLRIAAGEPLPFTQADIVLRGHAIEARLYAEDPAANFAPQTGVVRWFRPAALANRPGIRVDSGIEEGDVISPFYDAMVAKFIAHGRDREDAMRRLCAALADAPLVGVRSNQRALIDIMQSDAFRASTLDTGTLDRWQSEPTSPLHRPEPDLETWAVAAALLAWAETPPPFNRLPPPFELELQLDSAAVEESVPHTLDLRWQEANAITVEHGGESLTLTLLHYEQGELRYRRGDVVRRIFALREGTAVVVDLGHGLHRIEEVSSEPAALMDADPGRITSPIAGTLLRLEVAVDQLLAEGETVAIVEAMKMETRLLAGRAGRVSAIHVQVGDQLEAGALVAELLLSGPLQAEQGSDEDG